MKKRYILILIIIFIIMGLIGISSYNKNKVIENIDYKVVDLDISEGIPTLIVVNPTNKDLKCFKLKSGFHYSVVREFRIETKSDIIGKTINYKKIGNKIYNRVELKV